MSPTRERDERWFTDLYAARYADVVRYGRRRLADADAADELAQEVFTVAWRRRGEVPEHGLPWLYAVARRLLANYRRRAPAPLPLDDPDRVPGNATRPGDGDRVAEVRAALATLSEPDQEILRLIGWEELSVVEAAAVLGCTRTTATVRLHRARKRLVAALATRSRPPRPSRALAYPVKEL
jgi:RNA polymerase sigma factor (sigma-70 family)